MLRVPLKVLVEFRYILEERTGTFVTQCTTTIELFTHGDIFGLGNYLSKQPLAIMYPQLFLSAKMEWFMFLLQDIQAKY